MFFGIRPNAYFVAFWIGFGIDLGSILAWFLLKKRQQKIDRFGDAFWMNFNVIWEALGGPRVTQNASKNDAKNHQKK